MFSDESLEDFTEHLKYSSRHHIDKLNDIINSEEVLLNPLDGQSYSFIANSPEDVLKFVYRFTDISVFGGYLIKDPQDIWDNVDEDPPDYKFLPTRPYTKVNVNEYFDEDRQVETVFYPDQSCEQLDPSEVRVLPLDYPCAIQWRGEDTFERAGPSTIRLCTVIPLNRTHFIQTN